MKTWYPFFGVKILLLHFSPQGGDAPDPYTFVLPQPIFCWSSWWTYDVFCHPLIRPIPWLCVVYMHEQTSELEQFFNHDSSSLHLKNTVKMAEKIQKCCVHEADLNMNWPFWHLKCTCSYCLFFRNSSWQTWALSCKDLHTSLPLHSLSSPIDLIATTQSIR